MNNLPEFTIIIPARYESTRLPGKPLLDIAGKPMIQRVYEKATLSGAKRVIIATDNEKISSTAKNFSAEICMTSSDHQSGTERLAEVIDKLEISDDEIIVNVQGDEPLIPPSIIDQVAQNLSNNQAVMATLAVNIDDAMEIFDPNVVKVVTDNKNFALYFSRASIPWDRDNFSKNPPVINSNLKRHIGIYAYRAKFIKQYLELPPSSLEKLESLEQLRVLFHGMKIHVDIAAETPARGVDTLDDLQYVKKIIKSSEGEFMK